MVYKKKISQIQFDKTFLQNLLTKLTGINNGRSIHLSAVPSGAKRVDLTDLSLCTDKHTGATDFLKKLLNQGKWKFSIGWDEKSKTKMSEDERDMIRQLGSRLDTIVADNEELYQETGIKNFGFGYPLLVKKDGKNPRKLIVAPVFIWSLDIKKSSRKNEWEISKTEDSPIKVNEVLMAHLENDVGVKIQGLTSDVLDDNVLSENEIVAYLSNELFAKLNIGEKITSISLNKCPDKKTLEAVKTTTPWIQWSGVFGLYRSQKGPIIEATREILDNIDAFSQKELVIEPFQTTTTASFDLDPSQSEIINTLNDDEFKVIQGPPGTGKSQAISAIISNALANGAKTLVVCEKKTALDVLAQNLQKMKLDTFCVVIDEVTKDRRAVVQKARDLEVENPYISGYDEDVFKRTYDNFIRVRDRVNGAFQESSRPIFAGKNWAEIVGAFLHYSKSQWFDAIKGRFANLKIDYTPDSYGDYLAKVRQGAALFQQIEDVKDTDFYLLNMNEFGDSISIRDRTDISAKISRASDIITDTRAFMNKSEYRAADYSIASGEADISRTINNCIATKEITDVIMRASSDGLTTENVSGFVTALKDINECYKKLPCETRAVSVDNDLVKKVKLVYAIYDQIGKAKEFYKSGMDLVGDVFENKKTGFFKSWFSSDRARADKDKRDLRQSYKDICKYATELADYTKQTFELKDWEECAKISDAITVMDGLNERLGNVVGDINADAAAVADVAARNFANIMDFQKSCESILECQAMILQTNEQLRGIFPNLPGVSATYYNSLDEYKEKLTVIEGELNALSGNLGRLGAYNAWLKYYEREKVLFDMLLTAPVYMWEELFNGCFYYNFLLDFESKSASGLPSNQSYAQLESLRNLYADLQQQNVKKIYHHWYARRANAIDDVRFKYSGFKTLFALKKTQKFGKRLSLRQIIEREFDNFTTLFPIVMVNPIVANALLPLRPGLFDLVIFDEASQLRVEDVFTAMIRGKYKIIAGDKHQMPPSDWFSAGLDGNAADGDDDDGDGGPTLAQGGMLDAESLLEFTDYLKDKNMSYLDFHYRSQHPALIEFSNAAFYGGNLCPLPVNGDEYTPIKFIDVAGIYTSGKENVNKDEANAVLNIIDEIQPDDNGRYPSVGVATFNIHQRKLIWDKLYERSRNDSNFNRKFEALQAAGMFVKNLENIQGDERDIIIISTTFGRDENGRFLQNFGGISGQKGYKLLNVLVTRAKKRLFVVTSIPASYYSKYAEEISAKQQNTGRGILYAYLSYAKAISENNTDSATSVLKFLRQFAFDKQDRRGTNMAQTESVFEKEVKKEISAFVDPSMIKEHYQVGGYCLDFRIDINGHKIALECDGKKCHESAQAYMADMHRQKQIEKFGYMFYRIWSSDWFENKDWELKKFQKFIDGLK